MNFKKEIIEALEPYANPKISLLSMARSSIFPEVEKSDFNTRSAKRIIKVLSCEHPINPDEFRNMIKEIIKEGETEQQMKFIPSTYVFLKLLEEIESGEDPSFMASVRKYL